MAGTVERRDGEELDSNIRRLRSEQTGSYQQRKRGCRSHGQQARSPIETGDTLLGFGFGFKPDSRTDTRFDEHPHGRVERPDPDSRVRWP